MAVPSCKEIEEAFKLFDKNGDGTISVKEFGAVMDALGHRTSDSDVEKLLRSFDKDENGVLTIDEFATVLKEDKGVDHDEMREAFDAFDADHSGFITRDELKQTMKNVGEELSDKEIDKMIRNADTNKDGKVSFQEFKKMMSPQ